MAEPSGGLSESTPLLANDPLETSRAQAVDAEANGSAGPIPASQHFQRPIRLLTRLIFIASLTSLLFFITSVVLIIAGPFVGFRDPILDGGGALIGFAFFAAIVSVINLYFAFPILLNVIIDLIFAFYIIALSATSAFDRNGFPTSYGWCQDYYHKEPPTSKCLEVLLALQIILGIGIGVVAIVGFSHLTLLGMRIVAIFRTICGRRETWGSWRLPTGQLTFEFTIKVLRQERGEVSGPGGPVVEGSVVPHNDLTRGGSV